MAAESPNLNRAISAILEQAHLPKSVADRRSLMLAVRVLEAVRLLEAAMDPDGYLGNRGHVLVQFTDRIQLLLRGRPTNDLRTALLRDPALPNERPPVDVYGEWQRMQDEQAERAARAEDLAKDEQRGQMSPEELAWDQA